MYYVYHIRRRSSTSIEDGYIGISRDPKSRFRSHRHHLKYKTHTNPHLQSAWEKYNDIEFVILAELSTVSEMVDMERRLRPKPNIGWNCKSGGVDYVEHSEEMIQKRVAKILGRKHSEETKRKMSEAKKGIPSGRVGFTHTEETKQKLRELSTGVKKTTTTLEKLSTSLTTYVNPYLWVHTSGLVFFGTPKELRNTFLSHKMQIGSITRVLKGTYKQHKGWYLFE